MCCVVRNFLFKWAKRGLNVWWEKKWGNFEIRVAFFKLSIPIAVIKKEKKMKQKEVKEYKETHLPLISKKVDDYVWAMCAVYTAPAVGYWEEEKKGNWESLFETVKQMAQMCANLTREKRTQWSVLYCCRSLLFLGGSTLIGYFGFKGADSLRGII